MGGTNSYQQPINTEETTKTFEYPESYLGDGVYASYDGYHIVLAINHHTNKLVKLEPQVFEKLIEYNNQIKDIESPEKEG